MKTYKIHCFYMKLYSEEEPQIVLAHSMKEITDFYPVGKIESINCIGKSVLALEGILK